MVGEIAKSEDQLVGFRFAGPPATGPGNLLAQELPRHCGGMIQNCVQIVVHQRVQLIDTRLCESHTGG